MFKYDSYKIGTPSKLVIFIHGYNGTIADHQYAIDWLCKKLRNALLIIPQAPQISEKNSLKYQWFGMKKYDPENKRTQENTSSEEIFAIYNNAQKDVSDCAQAINKFIDDMQQKYEIDDAHTYLIGFSQGAMLAIYSALSRHHQLDSVFSLSGLIAAEDLLSENIKATPKVYLFHGTEDLKVQYKTLPDSIKWLQLHGINPQVYTYNELAHKICEAEINQIAAEINQNDEK